MTNGGRRDTAEQDTQGTGYVHGYSETAVRVLFTRTAQKDAAFFIPHLRPGLSLLDCGCGPGSITVGLAEMVSPGKVVGTDIDAGQIELARAHAAERKVSNVRFEVADMYHLPFADGSFDRVFIHAVLEHLKEPLAALVEVRRVLAKGGAVGVRHGDWDSYIRTPDNPTLRRSMELYKRVWRHGGGEPCFGKGQRALLNAAGFAKVEASASSWCFGTREATMYAAEAFARLMRQNLEVAVTLGWCDRREIEGMVQAWREWGEHPDTFWAVTWCEAVGWKE